MRLRSSLLLLVLATALPLVAFAVIVSAVLVAHDENNFVAAVKDRNRAFMSAVDAAVIGHIESLRVLTALPSIERNDLPQIHRDLVAAAATQRDWITVILLSPDGQQLIDSRVPYGTPLLDADEQASFRDSLATLEPSVGTISRGRLGGGFGVPIRLPIVRDGKPAYVLTAVVKQEAFEALLQRQEIPSGWVGGILAADGRLIARVPPRPPGSYPAPVFIEAIAKSSEGWNRMTTLEGIDNYTAHATSAITRWTVAIAIPASVVTGGISRATWMLFAGAITSIALGALLAMLLSRRIVAPIAQLASSAPLLGTEGSDGMPRTRIEEVLKLAAALKIASTAIREREQVAAEQRKALAAADRAKDEFIAMLSHELRNPLAALTNAAALLKLSKPGSEGMHNAQAIIERQTRQMTRLIDDLLDLSRIVTGKSAIELAPVDLSKVVSQVVQTWRDAGRLVGHHVSLETEPVWISADRARVEQIVSNLLDNAVKFTPPGRRISVVVKRADAYGRIVVADEGAGIQPEDIGRIFELFTQGPQGLGRQHGGMGVGLALVKRLVEMHAGRVSAESAGPDGGATFTVDFPASEPRSTASEGPGTVESSVVKRLIRVLVVDDHADSLAALASLLTLQGCIIRQASSGEAALLEITEHASDVALIDIGLPGIDGYELARRIRAMPAAASMKLIALTGYGQPGDIQRSLEAGFDVHLTKPVAVDVVKSLFDRILACPAGTDSSSPTRPAA
jgi:signal transduction histidine kinase/ActR/RegA family two-component response regulator